MIRIFYQPCGVNNDHQRIYTMCYLKSGKVDWMWDSMPGLRYQLSITKDFICFAKPYTESL